MIDTYINPKTGKSELCPEAIELPDGGWITGFPMLSNEQKAAHGWVLAPMPIPEPIPEPPPEIRRLTTEQLWDRLTDQELMRFIVLRDSGDATALLWDSRLSMRHRPFDPASTTVLTAMDYFLGKGVFESATRIAEILA